MEPYSQGDLDRLCSLYAVINAVRLITEECEVNRIDQSQKLFNFLLSILEDKGLLGVVLTKGAAQPLLSTLLREARAWLIHELGIRMSYTKPFHRFPNTPAKAVRTTIADHLLSKRATAIVRLTFPYDHWTVIAASQERLFALSDSNGLPHITHRNWATATGLISKRYRISPTSIFLIKSELGPL